MVRVRVVTCGTSREEAPTFGGKEEIVLSFKCLVLSWDRDDIQDKNDDLFVGE